MPFPWRGLRDYIADQEALGEVLRIKQPIKCGDPDSIVDTGWKGKTKESELRILLRYLQSLPKEPIGVIENPISNRPDVPVVINSWGTNERSLRAQGCATREEQIAKIFEIENKQIPPVKIDRAKAPCKEVVITEDKLDLEKDLPRLYIEFENSSWFTGGVTILRDEETGYHNIGWYRYGFYEWQEGDPSRLHPEELRKKYAYCTMHWKGARFSRGGAVYRKYREAGKPMPFAIAYGVDPALYATGLTRLRWPAYDEFAIAGGFRGEPVEVVESETVTGLYVPAHAEWIIEGEYLPQDYHIPEGAEAVWQGYIVGGGMATKCKIKSITHRTNPLWPITWSVKIRGDHSTFATPIFECEAIRDLREREFKVREVAIYDCVTAVVQSEVDGADKGDYAHLGKMIASALYSGRSRHASGRTLKYIIVVGPEVDPFNLREVIWALNTRVQPVSDSIFIEKGIANWGDPSAEMMSLGWRGLGEQQLIDALIKVPEKATWFPPVSEPKEWEKVNLEKIKAKIERV